MSSAKFWSILIVASSLAKHFTELDIFYEMQHGFREKRSCETQLIMLIDELSKNMKMGKQTDLILLEFSKAFDEVAHEKLLLKLHHYGIRGDTLKWIKDFLDNRKQAIAITGINSDITLFQLPPSALGIPEYPSDVPHRS